MHALPVVPQLPTRIGDLRVIARLGCGGMAEVFLARRTGIEGFDRRVVVKRMLPHLAQDATLATAMLDEGRILARLSHPNVVAVEEIGHDDQAYFLVMEHLRGATLSAIQRDLREQKARVDPALAAHIVSEVASGLHAAHELTDASGRWLELVHRDVTPHNVFLTIHGEVKLLDFGIAHFADRSARTRTGVAKGKLAYMAPEQFEGAPPERRMDVFALGVVLHELLSGRRLFAYPTEAEIVRAIVEGEIPRPSELAPDAKIPRALEDVCMCALSRRPEARFPTAAAMRAVLRAELRSLDLTQEVRDRAAELARIHAAEPEGVGTPVRETATLPEVPWSLRGDVAPPSERRSEPDALDAPTRVARPRRAPPSEHAEPRRPWWRWLVASAVLVAVALGGLAALTPAAPVGTVASAPWGAVPITIESAPSGAEVRVGGIPRGHTPLTIEADRTHEAMAITLALPGYERAEDVVVPDRARALRVHLRPE